MRQDDPPRYKLFDPYQGIELNKIRQSNQILPQSFHCSWRDPMARNRLARGRRDFVFSVSVEFKINIRSDELPNRNSFFKKGKLPLRFNNCGLQKLRLTRGFLRESLIESINEKRYQIILGMSKWTIF